MGHALQTISMMMLFMEHDKIHLLLNHQIAPFASLDSYLSYGDTSTNRLNAEKNAMRVLYNSMGGKSSMCQLDFSINPFITASSTIYSSLLGWEFSNISLDKEIVILNLFGQPQQLLFFM